jgi:putative transposase
MSAKQKLLHSIDKAVKCGARLRAACKLSGISSRSFFRWSKGLKKDGRKGAAKKVPRKLSEAEVEAFYKTATEPRFRDQTPAQIVATLLEAETYYGSERTLYRILKAKKANMPRTESKSRSKSRKPKELIATGPNQVWCWDITWIKTTVKGLYLYAYVVIDIYSRAIVGWSVESNESDEHARNLFSRIVRDTGVSPRFVHADNGGPMKGITLVAFLFQMGVGMSYSRPRVSDDNPFIESLFRTLKYHVTFPRVFMDLDHARKWFSDFVHWYNCYHRHSGIDYVTPHQRHTGKHVALLLKRQVTLNEAAGRHPERFVRGPKVFKVDDAVVLNRAA